MTPQTDKRPTHTVIDLQALAFNFHSSKKFIGSDVQYMAVVKADAYGHGASACALRLEAEGIDWFGVALPEEGVELRRSGVTIPILCLGSFWPGQENLIIENDLTPVIFDTDTAANLNRYAEKLDRSVEVHVKIDTGVGRVGVGHNDAASFAGHIKRLRGLRVTGLLTHFASAENPAENDYTNLQIERFENACRAFRKGGHDPQWIDLANSPAAIAHPASRGNMVRLGGALYGLLDDILPPETERPLLKPVLSLRSRIAHIRIVPVGTSLGYGRTFVTERDSRMALVPIGYADGYPRALSNLGKALISGCAARIAGRISMDWTLFDVTDIPDVRVNEEVVLIGGENENVVKAADLARVSGTISYEITCGITPRVSRIYVG